MDILFNKVLIIDGSYLLHRQLHQPNLSDLDYGGVFGFIRSISKEIHNSKNLFPVVAFDHGLSKRRINIDPYYKKANERDTEEKIISSVDSNDEYIRKYRTQRSKLCEILPYVGIPTLMFEGWEGDDIIYLLSKMCNESIISTDDRDMLQLVSENCNIRRPMADEFWDISKLKEDGYDDVFDFVIHKAIIGDKSDNIPSSCKGVGDIYAKKLSKLIRIFSEDRETNKWHNIDRYPKDDESMKSLCKKANIEFRKAYTNFDFERFIKNVELIDLCLVSDYNTIKTSMIGTLSNCNNDINYMNMAYAFGDMGIRGISIDTLMSDVFSRYRNLHLKNGGENN